VAMTGALEFALVGTVKRNKLTKEELVELWRTIVDETRMPIHTGVRVDGATRGADGCYLLSTSAGPVRTANVLLAVGRRGNPRRLEVPGEDRAKVHYRLLEPEAFRNKHVLVVGGGNSAVESALALSDLGGCASVTISYRRSAFARCRAEIRRRIDDAVGGGSVHALLPSEVVRIEEDGVELSMHGRLLRIANDAVIVQIGGTAPGELLQKFGVSVVTKRGEA
jgi:thioredoxin reductase (NADPH)